MAFCKNCGAELPEGAAFCSNCGAKAETVVSAVAEQLENQNDFSEKFNEKFNEFTNTENTTSKYDPADIEANKFIALISYIGLLFIVPLVAAKDSKFARFHANQGLVLFIAGIILGALNIIPILGTIVCVIGEFVVFVLAIIGIINAAKGEAKELPLIGKFKILN